MRGTGRNAYEAGTGGEAEDLPPDGRELDPSGLSAVPQSFPPRSLLLA